VRVTTTTICGTDVHILKGEYPVCRGLTIGHEPVDVIEKLGSAVQGYREGQRVIAGAITPSGYSNASLAGCHAQDSAGTAHGWKPLGGRKFGNTVDGCQAEYVLVPDAMANLALIPDGLTDEQVLMCPDIMSTGFAGAESGGIRIGDAVAVFAQGPIGLCAKVGARLMDATTIIAVESVPARIEMAKRLAADHVVDFRRVDAVREILRLTGDRRVDVAIKALAPRRPSRGACACCAQAAPCRASASTPVTCTFRSTPSRRASATTESSQRSARVAKSACTGSWRRWRPAAPTSAPSSRTASRSTRSRMPMICSRTSATACSRSRSHPKAN
jgi:threonine dehydrogenase-like Zn-dependent dehydrogenase